MKTALTTLFSLTATLVFFTACDSREEQNREKSLEKQADSLEKQAKETRKDAEKKADSLENAADSAREKK